MFGYQYPVSQYLTQVNPEFGFANDSSPQDQAKRNPTALVCPVNR